MSNKLAGYAWLIAIVLGVFICIYSIMVIPNKIKKEKTYIETTATVIDNEICTFDDGTNGTRYVAEYQVDRNKYTIVSNTCSSISTQLGKKVTVKYDPEDPSIAVFKNDIGNYAIPIIGIIFIICGIALKQKIKD